MTRGIAEMRAVAEELTYSTDPTLAELSAALYRASDKLEARAREVTDRPFRDVSDVHVPTHVKGQGIPGRDE